MLLRQLEACTMEKSCYYSDIAIISFNGNKIITSGGGGAVLTNKKNITKRFCH